MARFLLEIFPEIVWLSKIFGGGVTECIEEATAIHIQPTEEVCLLGLVDALAPRRVSCTLLTFLLYYARKLIVLSWKKVCPFIYFSMEDSYRQGRPPI